MKRLTLSFSFLFFTCINVLACSCHGTSPFCTENANHPNNKVFIGEIMRHDSLFTEFKIIHQLRGNETRTLVKIYDNPTPFNSCVGTYETESRFLGDVGDSILIILPEVDTSNANNYWGTLGDYYKPLGVCSAPVISLRNGALQGLITGSPNQFPQTIDSIPVNQFISNYVASSTTNDCDIFLGITKVNLSSFKIIPNPAKEFIYITIDNRAQVSKTELYSISGKLLFSTSSYINKIEINDFPNGIYLLQIELKNGEKSSKRLIKY